MSDRSAPSPRALATTTELVASQCPRRGLLPFGWISKIALCIDLIIIVSLSVLSGVGYHLIAFQNVGPVASFLGVGALAAVNFTAVFAARGTYQPKVFVDFWRQLRETSTVWLLGFFLLSLAAFSLKISETYSRGATFAFFAIGWFGVASWRFLASRFITRAIAEGRFAEQKIILIVEGPLRGSHVIDELKLYGYQPARTFEFSRSVFSPSASTLDLSELIEFSRKEPVECVFLQMSWDNRPAIEQVMASLHVLSVPVYLLPDSNVAYFLSNRAITIGATWIAELKRAPLSASERACKRVLDVLLASVALVMVAPMMILISLLIKLENQGPILFMQTRNGFNGRPFKIRKFRTMSVLEDGPEIRQATRDDPRVTHLGRILRRTNIDELPQLFNVIVGDMSLVGPRPHASVHNSEYEKIIANYAYRYHVKPGLTGWAQVNGLRGETQTIDLMQRRVEFDLWYINNWSLWLDTKILLRTLSIGLQPNAY
jgi:Undecaprenyl-phosphate glucose phosphotransferase